MHTRTKLRHLTLPTLGFTFALIAGVAWADLVIPEVAEAEKRFQDNPTIFDQTDQYCTDKAIDAACALPGNVFEGGGSGTCQRSLTGLKISLGCQRTESVEIDRQIPDKFSVDPPFPQVTDRFCAKSKEGASCTVELKHNGKVESYEGICQRNEDSQGYRFRPMVRSVLSCEPAKKTPERVYTPVSSVRKLFTQGL
jgi:hypothetical protein